MRPCRWTWIWIAVLLPLSVTFAAAQDHGGGGGGGGGGCGDVYGDLVHISRDLDTGQPILARRFVELPQEEPGYGWGYCPIAVDADGGEIGFLPFSCDPADLEATVDLDYFGRLSGGRTKEKNHRMHFDEVISTLKMADHVTQERTTGRLQVGFECEVGSGDPITCADWKVTDSPMESMALYTRLMKYGHLQTDPAEIDLWWHGDPGMPAPTHPALGAADWEKFDPSVRHLLPGDGEFDCYESDGTFHPECAATEELTDRDFVRAGSFLGGAADKTGRITRDLLQFTNRILRITLETDHTLPTSRTLPALVRDCEDPSTIYEPPEEDDPNPVDPSYLPIDECEQYEAYPELENYDLFYEVQERFVDYTACEYDRAEWRDESFDQLILPAGSSANFKTMKDVDLIPWLAFTNGPDPDDPDSYETAYGIRGAVEAASDALRAIEFVHNYAVPSDLIEGVDAGGGGPKPMN